MDETEYRMDVMSFTRTQRKAVRKRIEQLEVTVAEILALHALGGLTNREMESLIKRVRSLVDSAHTAISAEQLKELSEFANVATTAAATLIGSRRKVGPPINDVLFLGTRISDLWQQRGQHVSAQVTKALRIARANGEPDAKGVLFGRKGVFDAAMRQSEAAAEGTVLATDTAAKVHAGEGNKLLAGYRSSAMFDSRTCMTCATLDGELFDIDMVAVNPAMRGFGTAPYHPNCRCSMTPVLPTEGDGAALPGKDGKVSPGITFEEWIGNKSAKYQEDYFGPGRYALWKDGKITLNDLFSGNGKALTLPELAKKYG